MFKMATEETDKKTQPKNQEEQEKQSTSAPQTEPVTQEQTQSDILNPPELDIYTTPTEKEELYRQDVESQFGKPSEIEVYQKKIGATSTNARTREASGEWLLRHGMGDELAFSRFGGELGRLKRKEATETPEGRKIMDESKDRYMEALQYEQGQMQSAAKRELYEQRRATDMAVMQQQEAVARKTLQDIKLAKDATGEAEELVTEITSGKPPLSANIDDTPYQYMPGTLGNARQDIKEFSSNPLVKVLALSGIEIAPEEVQGVGIKPLTPEETKTLSDVVKRAVETTGNIDEAIKSVVPEQEQNESDRDYLARVASYTSDGMKMAEEYTQEDYDVYLEAQAAENQQFGQSALGFMGNLGNNLRRLKANGAPADKILQRKLMSSIVEDGGQYNPLLAIRQVLLSNGNYKDEQYDRYAGYIDEQIKKFARGGITDPVIGEAIRTGLKTIDADVKKIRSEWQEDRVKISKELNIYNEDQIVNTGNYAQTTDGQKTIVFVGDNASLISDVYSNLQPDAQRKFETHFKETGGRGQGIVKGSPKVTGKYLVIPVAQDDYISNPDNLISGDNEITSSYIREFTKDRQDGDVYIATPDGNVSNESFRVGLGMILSPDVDMETKSQVYTLLKQYEDRYLNTTNKRDWLECEGILTNYSRFTSAPNAQNYTLFDRKLIIGGVGDQSPDKIFGEALINNPTPAFKNAVLLTNGTREDREIISENNIETVSRWGGINASIRHNKDVAEYEIDILEDVSEHEPRYAESVRDIIGEYGQTKDGGTLIKNIEEAAKKYGIRIDIDKVSKNGTNAQKIIACTTAADDIITRAKDNILANQENITQFTQPKEDGTYSVPAIQQAIDIEEFLESSIVKDFGINIEDIDASNSFDVLFQHQQAAISWLQKQKREGKDIHGFDRVDSMIKTLAPLAYPTYKIIDVIGEAFNADNADIEAEDVVSWLKESMDVCNPNIMKSQQKIEQNRQDIANVNGHLSLAKFNRQNATTDTVGIVKNIANIQKALDEVLKQEYTPFIEEWQYQKTMELQKSKMPKGGWKA